MCIRDSLCFINKDRIVLFIVTNEAMAYSFEQRLLITGNILNKHFKE